MIREEFPTAGRGRFHTSSLRSKLVIIAEFWNRSKSIGVPDDAVADGVGDAVVSNFDSSDRAGCQW